MIVNDNWVSKNSFDKKFGSISPPSFPHEFLVRSLSSSLNSGFKPFKNFENLNVLEIGAFGANNLRYFWERGYKGIYAIETTKSLVEMCSMRASEFSNNQISKKNIVMGSNLEIPFDDNFFDLIISINTIHYSIEEDIFASLKLWKKKLKENGRIFVETAGPTHDFVVDSQRISKNKWTCGEKSGFRKGSLAGFFDSEDHWKTCIQKIFKEVSFGRIIEKSNKSTLDYLTAYCIK